jgi:hypothetical protein
MPPWSARAAGSQGAEGAEGKLGADPRGSPCKPESTPNCRRLSRNASLAESDSQGGPIRTARSRRAWSRPAALLLRTLA